MAKTRPPVTLAPQPSAPNADAERQVRIRTKLEKLLAHRDRAKREYGKAGSLLNELIREVNVGETITLSDGRSATLVDAFAKANYCYRNTSFTRCDFEVTG
jgi:hypothetical protein